MTSEQVGVLVAELTSAGIIKPEDVTLKLVETLVLCLIKSGLTTEKFTCNIQDWRENE